MVTNPMQALSNKRLFTPGPVMMSPDILKIGVQQTPYFRNKEFSDLLLMCETNLLSLVSAPKNSRVVFLTASGTAAMEASIVNLFTCDTPVAVINGGSFGQRFVDICQRHRIPVDNIQVDRDDLRDGLVLDSLSTGLSGLLINAHETSIGHLYDIAKSGAYCQSKKILHVVDAISTFVTDEINMLSQYIDVLILSSHKGLALPPGLAMIVLSPSAIERINRHNEFLYFDFFYYLENGVRGQTPFTPAISIFLQLYARLSELERSGIEHSINKANSLANYFRSKIERLNFETYSTSMPNAMTAVRVPNNIDASLIVSRLESDFDCVVAPNGGSLKNLLFRVSHMGHMSLGDIDVLVQGLEYIVKDICK